jgi:O-antigen ligase
MPDIGMHYANGGLAVRGIFGHKQSFGRVVVLSSTTFIPFIFKSKSKIGFYLSCLGLLSCFACAYVAQSKTSIISILILFLSLPFYILLSYSYNSGVRIRSLFFIISGLVALVFLALFFGNYETILVDILGKGTDINGRVPLWILSLQEGMQRPILGYGYGGFWASDVGISVAYRSWVMGSLYNPSYWNPGQIFVWHAHNGLIEIFLNLGIVGLTLTLLNLGHSVGKIFANLRINQSVSYYSTELHWMFLVLLSLFIMNSTEPYLLSSRDLLWTVYMCTALNLSSRRV